MDSHAGVGLLSVPDDLLVREILADLRLSSLTSCSRTCKQLHDLISSSILLTYLKELEISGMVDNPACSRQVISIKTRLEMLREREIRWINLDWKWRKGIEPPQLNLAATWQIADNDVLMVAKRVNRGEAVVGFYSVSLPRSMDKTLRWKEINIGKLPLPSTMSIEEHDLFACVTYGQHVSHNQLFELHVHLLQFSTLEPHPSATLPVLFATTYWKKYGSPTVHVSICGNNLALVVKYSVRSESSLTVWNWKTGVVLGRLWSDLPRTGLAFLRENLVVNVDLTKASIDVYQVSPSPESSSNSNGNAGDLQPFLRLKLPRLQEFFEYVAAGISAASEPSPKSSNPLKNKGSARPFIRDPLSTIFSIFFRINLIRTIVPPGNPIEPYLAFNLIIHRRVLLEYILQHPASVSSGQAQDNHVDIPEIPWEDWGIENTRMFAFEESKSYLTIAGTKCIMVKDNNVQILEFGRMRVAAERAHRQNDSGKTSAIEARPGVQVELVDYDAPTVYPDKNSVFRGDIITCLPYIRTSSSIGTEDEIWDDYFMDEHRVMGTKESTSYNGVPRVERLDILYFG